MFRLQHHLRTDHPYNIPHAWKFTVVPDLIVGGFRLPKVLMDWGSGINIIFSDTPAKMRISKSHLCPSPIGFHGFVPGKKVQSLGQISLEVVFLKDNFRSEILCFEVATFRSGYNAILGRQAYVAFMALPSYAYLQLKLPGPNGTITVHGSAERALEAEVALASAELEEIKRTVDPAIGSLPRKPKHGPAFQPVKEKVPSASRGPLQDNYYRSRFEPETGGRAHTVPERQLEYLRLEVR